MPEGLQLSARAVASLLAHIFGPSWYDGPRYGHGDLGRLVAGPQPGPWLVDRVAGPLSNPWAAVMLNPQPLPPRESYALALADAHIGELVALDRLGTLLGGEVAGHAVERSVRLVAEVEELCPRWPHWPKNWPPPPPPPWSEEMTDTALFVFGMRFLAAADVLEQGEMQAAVTRLGEKALDLSMPG